MAETFTVKHLGSCANCNKHMESESGDYYEENDDDDYDASGDDECEPTVRKPITPFNLRSISMNSAPMRINDYENNYLQRRRFCRSKMLMCGAQVRSLIDHNKAYIMTPNDLKCPKQFRLFVQTIRTSPDCEGIFVNGGCKIRDLNGYIHEVPLNCRSSRRYHGAIISRGTLLINTCKKIGINANSVSFLKDCGFGSRIARVLIDMMYPKNSAAVFRSSETADDTDTKVNDEKNEEINCGRIEATADEIESFLVTKPLTIQEAETYECGETLSIQSPPEDEPCVIDPEDKSSANAAEPQSTSSAAV